MKLIGITGKKGSGKTTAGELIKMLYPEQRVVCVGFADALKAEIAGGAGVSVDYMTKHKDNFRLIMQGWGTDFRRRLNGENYWVRKVEDIITSDDVQRHVKILVVTDVRFSNEADMIERHNGLLLRLYRPATDDYEDQHPSEREMDNFKDVTGITNNGTLTALKSALSDVVNPFLGLAK